MDYLNCSFMGSIAVVYIAQTWSLHMTEKQLPGRQSGRRKVKGITAEAAIAFCFTF